MGSRRTNLGLRSASFSEYLNHEAEDCARYVSDSVPEYELPVPVLPGKIDPGDCEVDVFDAKMYFNVNSDVQAARDKTDSHIQARKSGTPSMILETRSGVRNPFQEGGSVDIPHQKKKNGRARSQGILSGFGFCSCCADAKSVQVDGESQVKKSSKNPSGASVSGSDRTEGFEFPILNTAEPLEEQPRNSLDVFGLDVEARGGDEVALNLERKLSMLTWDAIPKARSFPPLPRFDAARMDDADSCASSDLFEIESISAICRDGIPRPPRTGAPSEKEIQKRSGSSRLSLLGCKSQKSVNVVEPGQET